MLEPVLADDEEAALTQRRLELRHRAAARAEARRRPPRSGRAPARTRRSRLRLGGKRRAEHGAVGVDDDGGLDLRGDLRQVGESGRGIHGANRRYSRRAPPVRPTTREVLRRPRHPPRGDDRLLRPPLLGLADLPRAGAARLHRAGRGVELSRPRAAEALPVAVDHGHRQGRRRDHLECDDARPDRRRVPALDVALALQRARVGVQHRLRAAEPPVPAREVPRDAVHGRLADHPLGGARRSARSATT